MDFLTWLSQTGQALLPLATVISLAVSALIGFFAFRRQDVREHYRWLQEKRREAYVDFLSANRQAYGSIANRPGLPEPEREAASDRDEDQVNYAQNVLEIVGPKYMADRGREVIARLKLDRLYYSPDRITQLLDHKDKYLQRAKDTGKNEFHRKFVELYEKERFDTAGYEALHREYPLRKFWEAFAVEARDELAKAHPGFWSRIRNRFLG
jgi:hypothetical protein